MCAIEHPFKDTKFKERKLSLALPFEHLRYDVIPVSVPLCQDFGASWIDDS